MCDNHDHGTVTLRPDAPGRAFVHVLAPTLEGGTRICILLDGTVDEAVTWLIDGIVLRVIDMDRARRTGHPAGYEVRLVAEPRALPRSGRAVAQWREQTDTRDEVPTPGEWTEQEPTDCTTQAAIDPSSAWGGGTAASRPKIGTPTPGTPTERPASTRCERAPSTRTERPATTRTERVPTTDLQTPEDTPTDWNGAAIATSTNTLERGSWAALIPERPSTPPSS